MARGLVAAVNGNYRAAFLKFAGHIAGADTREFGSITGVSLGLPAPLYNQLLTFETPARESVDAAVDWMTNRDVPFWLSVPEAVAEAGAVDSGAVDLVECDDVAPGMVMAPLMEVSATDTAASITEVTDPDALDAFIRVFAEVFGLPKRLAQHAYPASMLDDADIKMFVGRLDARVVACGQLVAPDDVAGIYSIGVLEGFRRQGLGEAMTWEALRAGREAGCEVGALQSSEMARSLYQRMGFETVTTYHRYGPGPDKTEDSSRSRVY